MNQPSPHTLNSRRSPFMQTVLIAMFAVTIVAGLAGAYIARCLFKKHFEKAGLV